MSVLKRNTRRRRHVGRRVAVVAAGVALIVVGLEAPAFAATPTVASFTPTSGPAGCIVDITGTNFKNPAAQTVSFGATSVPFTIISDTEILAKHPGGVTGFISVANADGSGSSTTQFSQAQPGGCAPTITSFTPTCGPDDPAGAAHVTEVTITGTNLLKDVGPVGGDVWFGPHLATPDSGTKAIVNNATSTTELVVQVPAGATDDPISVVTFNNTVGQGAVFSATPFDVGTCITELSPTSGGVGTTVTITGVGFDHVTAVNFFNGIPAVFTLTTDTSTTDVITTTVPFGATTGPITLFTADAQNGTSVQSADFTVGTTGNTHPRNVTLKLSGKLKMSGKVKVPDGTTECANAVPVKLQRKKKGDGWKTLKTVTTDASGAYSGKVRNKPGKFRSIATKVTLDDASVCLKDVSPVRKN